MRRTHQASQWWHDRQSHYLQWQANQIRDRLLQKLFVVRRSLELYRQEDDPLGSEHCQAWLSEIEQVHRSLRLLSDQLFPCHLEESLPAALRYEMERWQEQNPQIALQLDLPPDWANEPPERIRTILMTLGELLRIALPQPLLAPLLEPVEIRLAACSREGEMQIRITYPDLATRIGYSRSHELLYLSRSFQLLTSGWCVSRHKGRTAAWSFRWQLL